MFNKNEEKEEKIKIESSKLQKKMEKDDAFKVYDEIFKKVVGEDIDDAVEDFYTDNAIEKSKLRIKNSVLKAISCGLVFYDEKKECVVQQLCDPLKSGTLEPRTHLYFRSRICLKDLKMPGVDDETEKGARILAKVTQCPQTLIEQLKGQDFTIAMAVFQSFFEK